MLKRLWSEVFRRDGQPRPVIEFHPGLNIIEGADDAQNSIGKSTFMQIIDFVYGGSQFLESDVVRLPDAVGHHTICFTLRLHGKDYHFSRSTERIGYVATYTDPDWKFSSGDMPLNEYSQFLLDNYGLSYTQTSWRDIVGRFSRLDEEALGTLDFPLAAVPQQSATAGAIAMLRLNGTY